MKPTRTHSARPGALVALFVLTSALLAAGCGSSSSSPGVAHLSSHTSAGPEASGGGGPSSSEGGPTQQQMIAFSKCMRSHGVPEFPEPTEGHLLVRSKDNNTGQVKSGPNLRSPKFQAARKACSKLLPNGGVPSPAEQARAQEAALTFSRCMRTHGVPSFPDPTFSGNAVRLKVGKSSGIDPNSPQFKAAQKACQGVGPKLPDAKGGPTERSGFSSGGPKGP
jgi:hypothetical protein